MENVKIVTGTEKYVAARCSHFYKLGYTLFKKHEHPNGSVTAKLVYARIKGDIL